MVLSLNYMKEYYNFHLSLIWCKCLLIFLYCLFICLSYSIMFIISVIVYVCFFMCNYESQQNCRMLAPSLEINLLRWNAKGYCVGTQRVKDLVTNPKDTAIKHKKKQKINHFQVDSDCRIPGSFLELCGP